MPFVYFGRTHSFVGKSIWEIAGSLKNFGVGRMVYRNRYKRYSEPCFMRITKSEPNMDEDNKTGTFLAEVVFRGVNYGEIDFSHVAYKTDYILVPKHEEFKFTKAFQEYEIKDIKIFPRKVEMPPLLRLVAEQRGHHLTTEFDMTLKVVTPRARIAREGEAPNREVSCSLGIPATPRLYEGILDQTLESVLNKTKQDTRTD